MTTKYFYAVQFMSGRNTTTGQPNAKTGYYSNAVGVNCFKTSAERDEWVSNGESTSAMRGNCRESVSKKELRDLCLGSSIIEFNEMLENIQFQADNDI